jgi:1-acyl-sn-glycerol-3-phosphate acyltransferase
MQEKLNNISKKIVGDILPKAAYRLEINQTSKNRIETIKDYLKNRPETNYIGYCNHVCFSDPLFAGHTALLIDPKQTRHIIAPISYSHTDTKRTNTSGTLAMKKIIDLCGIETIPVVQDYQVDQKDGYTKEEAIKTYRILLDRLENLKNSKTPTGCLICPEGHRSEDGTLKEGKKGILSIAKKLQPVVFIPIGIVYQENYNRNGLNIGKRLNLNIGEMMVYEKVDKNLTLDILMRNLAETLPIKMRGQWANKLDLIK